MLPLKKEKFSTSALPRLISFPFLNIVIDRYIYSVCWLMMFDWCIFQLFNSSQPSHISHCYCTDVCKWKRECRWEERSGVLQPLFPHRVTSHSRSGRWLLFPSVFSEAPQLHGGAFYPPFPSTFCMALIIGGSPSNTVSHKLAHKWNAWSWLIWWNTFFLWDWPRKALNTVNLITLLKPEVAELYSTCQEIWRLHSHWSGGGGRD